MMSGTTGSTRERGASAPPSDGSTRPPFRAGAASAGADGWRSPISTSGATPGTAGRNSDSISAILACIALRRFIATSTVTLGLASKARSRAAKAER